MYTVLSKTIGRLFVLFSSRDNVHVYMYIAHVMGGHPGVPNYVYLSGVSYIVVGWYIQYRPDTRYNVFASFQKNLNAFRSRLARV